jgi:glutaryl-CoA dehydrogenase
MGELGLLGAHLTGYGCAGASTVASGLITRAVERVDSGYRSGMSVQSSLVMTGIHTFGTAEQKDKFLPDMAKGKVLGAFGLTEPNHGSDPGAMETTARPHPTKKGYLLLRGSKTWITNSPISDVLLVWARLQETGKIKGFLVERKDCPAGTLETPQIKNKNGLRASMTGMIHMEDCPVPEANMFPEVQGLSGPFTCLNSARMGIAFGVMGALEDCISRTRTYALERKQFKGNPLAKYQLVQKKLADAVTDAAYGVLASIQVARLKDQGLATPEMISMIKRQNCDRALWNARILQEVFGGNAVSDEYGIGRHVANLFVTQTYEGQSDIHSEYYRGVIPASSVASYVVSRTGANSVSRFDTRPGHHWYSGVCMTRTPRDADMDKMGMSYVLVICSKICEISKHIRSALELALYSIAVERTHIGRPCSGGEKKGLHWTD